MENENLIQLPIPGPIIESVSPIPPASSDSNKMLIVLVGLFFLIAVVGIVAYALGSKSHLVPAPQPTPIAIVKPTPTPDPTADWETYTNIKYNYSFKYPTLWALVPYKEGRMTEGNDWLINKPEYISNINEFSYSKNDFSNIFFNVILYEKEYTIGGQKKIYDNSLNLKEYIKNITGATDDEIINYVLDGKPALMRIDKRSEGIYSKLVFLKIKEGILSISYTRGQTDIYRDTIETTFDQILSTFKFTE